MRIPGFRQIGIVGFLGILLFLSYSSLSCKQAQTPPTAMAYNIAAETELTRVRWYLSEGKLNVEVSFKNMSSVNQTYEVAAKVDNEPWCINSATQVGAGAEAATVVATTLTNCQPGRLNINITRVAKK